MASTNLTKTFSSSGNRKTMTFSTWIKRSSVATSTFRIITCESGSGDPTSAFNLNSNQLEFVEYSAGDVARIKTNALYRDANAWYHIVLSIDTTQATASDRIKLYVNGEQITSLATATYPSQNTDFKLNSNLYPHIIGSTNYSAQYFDGSMAHVHFIDGTAYDASTFGETDATTGIWKPKTAPSVTYGTNGFFLKFENSAAFGTDSSGNSNTFTVNGTMTQTIDTPSNVFATWNPLDNYYLSGTFSNGSTTVEINNSSTEAFTTSSLGVSSGKWYMENKIVTTTSGRLYSGVVYGNATGTNDWPGGGSDQWFYRSEDGLVYNGGSLQYTGSTLADGDIVGIAMDLDNHKLYFSKNGTWQNSGDPTSGATGTGALNLDTGQTYFFAIGDSGSTTVKGSTNFGNGYFGTTAVSSAENPDDGIGIFEYAVPTGYKALCTKSINAQEYD